MSNKVNLRLGVLRVPDRSELDGCWLENFGGRTFIERQIRLVKLAGVCEVVVVCPARMAEKLRQQLACDTSVKVRGIDNETAPGDVLVQKDMPGCALVLVRANDVFEASFYKSLGAVELSSQSPLAFVRTGDGEKGIWLADTSAIGQLDAILAGASETKNVKEHLRAGDMLVGSVERPEQLAGIEDLLWARCRKRVDGFVSRWFNRYVSVFISRRLVRFRITPNQVTMFALLPGLAAAFLAAQGGYWPVLAGAVLLQINSIIDGVDGELARIKVEMSHLGEWLDTLSDALVNISFIVALGVGVVAGGGDQTWLDLALYNGAAMLVFTAIYGFWLWRTGTGAILSTSWFDGQAQAKPFFNLSGVIRFWVRLGTSLFRRDTMIAMIFFAALLGVAKYVLILFAFTSTAVIVAQLARAAHMRFFAGQREKSA